jgi:hypothetical protein
VATKSLAADNFFADPRAPTHPNTGYVPLVWATSLYHL